MPNLITNAMEFLEETLRGNAGQSGTLTRGTDTTASVTAVLDTVTYELADEGSGGITSYISVDLLIKPADYQIAGAEVDPARGDKWTYSDEFGTSHEYTVMFLGDAPVFHREPHNNLMRVHTKET